MVGWGWAEPEGWNHVDTWGSGVHATVPTASPLLAHKPLETDAGMASLVVAGETGCHLKGWLSPSLSWKPISSNLQRR